MELGRSAGILREVRRVNGFDGPLVGDVDGQPRPANPHGYWVLCCYQAPIKRRKERFRARNSPENARLGGNWNTATWPQPAPTLASAADKEKASARLASSNWWTERGSNPRPLHCERSALPAELSARRGRILYPAGDPWQTQDLPAPAAARRRRSATAAQAGSAGMASTAMRSTPAWSISRRAA